MTNINLDLAVKLDGSESHMLAVLVDSWGDKLVIPMMCDTVIEGGDYFIPCAHCGNAVLECNFENGSDCCDRCNEGKLYLPHPKRKLESGQCVDLGYHEDQTEEIMQMMSECVHTSIHTCTGTCWISDICVKRDELRKSVMLNMAVTQTLPEDIKMEVTLVKNRVVVNQNLTRDERVSLAVEAAVSVFWETIAASFPDATEGDLSPHATAMFEDCAEKTVKEWTEFNVPKKECYRGEIEYFDDLHLHYRDVWHQLHTGGGCMVAVTDNIAIDGSYRYMGVTSECVCIYTDTFEEGDFLQEHMEDCAWSYGENPTTLMNIIDDAFGGSALWNTGHLFDDIMTLGKSGKC